jgi:prepilin-type N-terminal cleavage/methylation domain-containing protein
MKSLVSSRRRTGFTLPELLVAMALIVLIMSILAQSFSAGAQSFRHLKAIGDMAERLRNSADALRQRLDAAGAQGAHFIRQSLTTGTADTEEAAALRVQYEDICAEAEALQVDLSRAEELIDNPGALRIVRAVRTDIERIKVLAASMVHLLRLIEAGRPPDSDLRG